MALVERRECDVFGKAEEARPYHIVVAEIVPPAEEGDVEQETQLCEWRHDLCERALDRLLQAINKGASPPKKRAAK